MSSSSPGRPRSLNRLSQNRTVASYRPILAAISGALRPCSTACRTILRPANKAGTERARARHPCQLVGFVIAQRPHPKGHGRAPEQNQALPQRAEDQKAANNLPDAPLSLFSAAAMVAAGTERLALCIGKSVGAGGKNTY